MAKIIGIRNSEFKGSDDSLVKGVNIYLTGRPLMKGEGLSSDRVFVTEDKILQWNYHPKVGDEVRLSIRYGRCGGMEKV